MANPTVSILMPVYNAAPYVRSAVESMLAQTYGDFELLIINDGSKDNSREVLASFGDDRIRILDQENLGLVKTLNRGIREARGQYIARMDSDDISLPNRLSEQMAHLRQHPEIALLGGFVSTIDDGGRTLSDVVRFPVGHQDIWKALGRRAWVMCHPTVVFRKDVAVEIGLYNPAFRHAEDAEFFGRLMSRYPADNLPSVVLQYRLRPDAVCTEHKDHGRINAQLVARIIDRWKPGQPFEATPDELAQTDELIERTRGRRSLASVRSVYHCRLGRELLRGSRWVRAAAAYGKAAMWQPWRALPYLGLMAACLHLGAASERFLAESS